MPLSQAQELQYGLWISRLGLERVNEQLEEAFTANELADLRKQKIREKSRFLAVRCSDDLPRLERLVLDGFGGPYHQTIFIRRTDLDQRTLAGGVAESPIRDGIRASVCNTNGVLGVRRLFFVSVDVQFLERQEDQVLYQLKTNTIEVPATIDVLDDKLIFRQMKMELHDWEPILNARIDRIIRRPGVEEIRDKLISYLRDFITLEVFEPVNFSQKAQEVMLHENVTTYSGHKPWVVDGLPVAEAAWKTFGRVGEPRPGLREIWGDEFDELVHATTVAKCQMFFNGPAFGVAAGAKFYLNPIEGEVSTSSMADQGAIDEFIHFVAS